jgi:hypothetical protein
MEILHNTGTYTSGNDEAVANYLISQLKDGRVPNWLEEMEVYQISSSSLGIKTGYAIVQGRMVVNRSAEYINNAVLPSTDTLRHIVIKITIVDSNTASVEVINRDYVELTQVDIKVDDSGVYEAELARYYIGASGIFDLSISLSILDIMNKDNIPAAKSAYDIWLDLGNEGSEEDFIASLVGAGGPEGPQGLSAVGKSTYDIWLDQGNEGSEADFLASLIGADGAEGHQGITCSLLIKQSDYSYLVFKVSAGINILRLDSIPAYSAIKMDYIIDYIIYYNQKNYKYINSESAAGQQPDISPEYWEEFTYLIYKGDGSDPVTGNYAGGNISLSYDN